MPSDDTAAAKRPTLLFDHNVIEHLGIKLYQNKPANVFAELVANSWDADATKVWIDIKPGGGATASTISIADDGTGMDLKIINERYLVIGKEKRKTPKDKSPGGRMPMGRKGIGKLAPFGIAERVDIVSVKDGKLNWFILELSELRKKGAEGSYEPKFPLEDADLTTVLPSDQGSTTELKAFVDRVQAKGQGTLVLMSKLTPNELPDREKTVSELSRRFTVILARPDFEVFVDGTKITAEEAVPDFELRIPPAPGTSATEMVGDKEVRYWVGFFEKAGPTIDEAGVGVFVHGKIAQDRPFFFRVTGKEVFHRYLYGVVEADWLDELPEDLVSTDRTSIDWEAEAAAGLAKWGKAKVAEWLTLYSAHRATMHLGETRNTAKRMRSEKRILIFSEPENEQIDKLVAGATKELPKSQVEKAREDLLDAVTKAWINEPTRRLLKSVWDGIDAAPTDAATFNAIVDRLEEHSVPEAMGLALTFAQRAYAVTVLTQVINDRSEENLQELIEVFPWILDPQGDLLTANQQLKTTIEKAADKINNPNPHEEAFVIQGISEKNRADFVFLTDPAEKMITITEIKAPGLGALQRIHERQLIGYLDFVESTHSSAKISGVLVGNAGTGASRYAPNDKRVIVKSWDEVLGECRASYIELLAAMLSKSDITPNDSRIDVIHQFAGDQVWELLGKLADKDVALARLMQKLSHLTDEPDAGQPADPDGASGDVQDES